MRFYDVQIKINLFLTQIATRKKEVEEIRTKFPNKVPVSNLCL